MPPHRDWTRRGVGRALLWWPFTAFLLVAAFPAVAVPAVAASGVLLLVIGFVGGALGRRWRARRLRRAGRTIGAVPRADAEGPAAPMTDAATARPSAAGESPARETPSRETPPEETPDDEPDDEGPDVRAA